VIAENVRFWVSLLVRIANIISHGIRMDMVTVALMVIRSVGLNRSAARLSRKKVMIMTDLKSKTNEPYIIRVGRREYVMETMTPEEIEKYDAEYKAKGYAFTLTHQPGFIYPSEESVKLRLAKLFLDMHYELLRDPEKRKDFEEWCQLNGYEVKL